MFRTRTLIISAAIIGAMLLYSGLANVGSSVAEGKARGLAVTSSLAVVARRIDGMNNHNLEEYLAAHHHNVRIFENPDVIIGNGRSHLKRIFGPLIEQGIGSIEVQYQVAIANTVVSEELVNYGGDEMHHIVAIYSVEDGLITSIQLIESMD